MEKRIQMMLPHLNEMQKRLFLASEAIAYGRGGIAKVIQLTGASRNTIKRGINELNSGITFEGRVARKVSDEDFESLSIVKIPPFEAWNYKLLPT